MCHENGINTCLDTSGSILNKDVKELLQFTDLVLLDIKYTNAVDYKKYVGCDMTQVLNFLDYLNTNKIKTVARQVVIPTLTDTEANIKKLKALIEASPAVQELELLPFKKLCQIKYKQLNKPFPFEHIPEMDVNKITPLYKIC